MKLSVALNLAIILALSFSWPVEVYHHMTQIRWCRIIATRKFNKTVLNILQPFSQNTALHTSKRKVTLSYSLFHESVIKLFINNVQVLIERLILQSELNDSPKCQYCLQVPFSIWTLLRSPCITVFKYDTFYIFPP